MAIVALAAFLAMLNYIYNYRRVKPATPVVSDPPVYTQGFDDKEPLLSPTRFEKPISPVPVDIQVGLPPGLPPQPLPEDSPVAPPSDSPQAPLLDPVEVVVENSPKP